MRYAQGLFVVLLLICFMSPAFSLPTDVEVQRYLLAAIKKNEAGDYLGAKEYYDKIIALNVSVPVDFHYHYGVVLNKSGDYTQAFAQLEKYINKAGQSGKYYLDALDQLTTAEEEKNRLNKKKKEEYSERLASALKDSVVQLVMKDNGRNEILPTWCDNRSAAGAYHSVGVKFIDNNECQLFVYDKCDEQVFYELNSIVFQQIQLAKNNNSYVSLSHKELYVRGLNGGIYHYFENNIKAQQALQYFADMADVCQ